MDSDFFPSLFTGLPIPSPMLSAERAKFCLQNITVIFNTSKKENEESEANLKVQISGAALALVLPIKGQRVM